MFGREFSEYCKNHFRIPAVKSICRLAEIKARQMGHIRHSIRCGQGNYTGFIFQYAWERLCGGTLIDSKHCDYSMPDNWNKSHPHHFGKAELKAKERKGHYIEPYWDVSVADHAGMGINQDCDFYAFGHVSMDFSGNPMWIWFLGGCIKHKYLYGDSLDPQPSGEKDYRGNDLIRFEGLKTGAEKRLKGEIYDDNNFECKEDCWNRRFDFLDPYKLTDLPTEGKVELQKILAEARTQGYGGSDAYMMGKSES